MEYRLEYQPTQQIKFPSVMLQSQPVRANASFEIFWNIYIKNRKVFKLNNNKG